MISARSLIKALHQSSNQRVKSPYFYNPFCILIPHLRIGSALYDTWIDPHIHPRTEPESKQMNESPPESHRSDISVNAI